MTHLLIDKLEKLEKEATEGPWHIGHLNEWPNGHNYDCTVESEKLIEVADADGLDACLIVELRNNYKKLIRAIGVLEKSYQKAKKIHDDELGIGNNYHEAWTEFVIAMDDAESDVKELLG